MFDLPNASHEQSDQRVPPTLGAQTMRRAETWARWVAMHWPEVKIAEGNVTLTRIAARPRLQAWACVTLGHLLPADVRVEAVPESGDEGIAMFSIAALRNGRYRFAANTAAGEGGVGRGWTIRIAPAREMPGGLELDPVELVSLELVVQPQARAATTRGIEPQEVAS